MDSIYTDQYIYKFEYINESQIILYAFCGIYI